MINMTAKEPANGEYRVYWYMCSYADACNFTTKTPKRPVEAFYPPSITIALNSRSVSTADIGGRARAAPLDITDLVPMSSEISNSMVVNYNVSSMFVGMVMLAKRHTITSMIREIRARNTVPADLVRKTFFKETANNDDDDEDLVSTGALVSLRCPLGLVRITTPSRSKYCQHSQCFDCECFLQMKQRVPTIKCPVCSLDIKTWRELIVDCYFEDILNNTSSSDSHVYIEADGSWKPKEQMLAQDLDSRQKRKRSVDVNSQDAIDLSDFSCSEDNLARGNKRRRADVIDLTLDSDDDDYDDDDYDIDGNGNAGDHVYGGDGHQGADSIDSAETNSLSGNSDYSELPPLTQEDIEFIDTVEATAAGNIGNSGNAGNAENAQGQLAAAPALATTSMPEPSASNSQAPASLPRLSIGASTLQASVPPAAALTTTPLSPQQATTPWSTA
ncbi:E3 SUMO-protein ligase pli1, partial [Coemansia sp. RSA 2599]